MKTPKSKETIITFVNSSVRFKCVLHLNLHVWLDLILDKTNLLCAKLTIQPNFWWKETSLIKLSFAPCYFVLLIYSFLPPILASFLRYCAFKVACSALSIFYPPKHWPILIFLRFVFFSILILRIYLTFCYKIKLKRPVAEG